MLSPDKSRISPGILFNFVFRLLPSALTTMICLPSIQRSFGAAALQALILGVVVVVCSSQGRPPLNPVDCSLSEWTQWTRCDPCLKKRFRSATLLQPSQFGGEPCNEVGQEEEPSGKLEGLVLDNRYYAGGCVPYFINDVRYRKPYNVQQYSLETKGSHTYKMESHDSYEEYSRHTAKSTFSRTTFSFNLAVPGLFEVGINVDSSKYRRNVQKIRNYAGKKTVSFMHTPGLS
ncbi:hypothetical protein HF521_020000 [Silurus meridionalis]|uniref:Uncharacterized protein n=1 Tax=Silurus meridionalis TaxID=175797 RepID=A0A8T0BMS9_SILME|nr:hypothetical protein HF521_020000 [Silurus meridionalis]